MKKMLLAIIVLCLMSNKAHTSDKVVKLNPKEQTPLSSNDLLSIKRIQSPKISPDGKWVLYTLKTPDLAKGNSTSDLYMISIDGNTNKQLTDDFGSCSDAIWMDNSKIAFISTKLGKPQLYTKTLPDGNPEIVTLMKNGAGDPKLSKDGKYFLISSEYEMELPIKDKYPALRKVNAYVYDKLPIRHWDTWRDELYKHPVVIPSTNAKGKEIDIMEGEMFESPVPPFGGSDQYDWSPEVKEIAYTAKKVDDWAKSTNTDIYLFSFESKSTINISSSNLGYDMNPAYSPDGMWIAYQSMARAGFEADRNRLMLYDRTNKTTKELTTNFDLSTGKFQWMPDSKSIIFDADIKGREHLFQIDISNSEIKQITNGDYSFANGFDISPDGKFLVVGRTSMIRPVDFFKINLTGGGEPQQITNANSLVLMKAKDVKFEEKYIKTSDGEQMHTWVIYPPDFDPAKKYPLIVYCQGGPQSMVGQYFSYRWNFWLMASQGYVVIAPNRRGAPGFGQKWVDDISKDWGGKAMKDILVATDAMTKEPFIDKAKVAAVGASAGGFTTFWLAGNHDKRFSAFISHCGVFNFESMYGTTEEQFFSDWEFGGPYWDSKNEDYYESSPHRFAKNWDTPILIFAGEKDFRVPYTQSLEAFTVAQTKGIPSKLVIFPEENHWVLGLHNAMLWNMEFYNFLDIHCKNKK